MSLSYLASLHRSLSSANYNSSDDDEEEEEEEENADEQTSEEEENDGERDLDDEGGKYQRDSGITKFSEGCRAFRTAFLKIMNKHLPNDPLGPILSAHKKLVAEKLLEEETEHKAKGQAKTEKHLAGEKGHVRRGLRKKERLLISIATKGGLALLQKRKNIPRYVGILWRHLNHVCKKLIIPSIF